MNTEKFIEKAKEIHDESYDYSLVNYVNSVTEVTLICPKHGEFKIKASSHLLGRGCHICRLKPKRIKINETSRSIDFNVIKHNSFNND